MWIELKPCLPFPAICFRVNCELIDELGINCFGSRKLSRIVHFSWTQARFAHQVQAQASRCQHANITERVDGNWYGALINMPRNLSAAPDSIAVAAHVQSRGIYPLINFDYCNIQRDYWCYLYDGGDISRDYSVLKLKKGHLWRQWGVWQQTRGGFVDLARSTHTLYRSTASGQVTDHQHIIFCKSS